MSTLRNVDTFLPGPRDSRDLFFAVMFFGGWELYGRLGDGRILPPFTEVLPPSLISPGMGI